MHFASLTYSVGNAQRVPDVKNAIQSCFLHFLFSGASPFAPAGQNAPDRHQPSTWRPDHHQPDRRALINRRAMEAKTDFIAKVIADTPPEGGSEIQARESRSDADGTRTRNLRIDSPGL